MQAPNLPVVARVIASVFSTIAWLLHVLDTYFQWRTVRDKSKNYLWKKISFLAVVIAGDIFIIAYVECEIKEERTTWVPAWWALIGFSMLLSLSVEAMAAKRINLDKDNRRKSQIYVAIIYVVVAVLLFDGTAFALIFLELQPLAARILVALGNFTAHGCLCCLVITLLMQSSPKETSRQKLYNVVTAKRARGVLCCLASTFAAAIMSMALLKAPAMYPFLLGELVVACILSAPWIVLQAYKLESRASSLHSTESETTDLVRPGA